MSALSNPAFKIITGWTLTKTNAGSTPTVTTGNYTILTAIDSAVLTESFILLPTVIAAGANIDINVNSFTDLAGNAATITKAATLFVKATGTSGGQLKIKPSTSNPLNWFLSGTTPAITLNVGTLGLCGIAIYDGVNATVSSGACQINISNPGSTAITVSVEIKCG